MTAANGAGSGSVATYLSGVVGAPTVVSEPVITGDANVDGTTFSVSHGTWTASPTAYAYQWSSCSASTFVCTPIAGATSSTYLVSVSALNGTYLTVDVTASNASGSADNVVHPSFAVGIAHTDVVSSAPVAGVPVAVINPSWTGDASQVGNVLVGDLVSGRTTRRRFPITGIAAIRAARRSPVCLPALTYTVQAGDAGTLLEFAVDGFNFVGQSIRYGFYGYLVNNTYVSQAGPAGAPEPLLPPQLTGDATDAGSVIQVTPVNWSAPQDPSVTVFYQLGALRRGRRELLRDSRRDVIQLHADGRRPRPHDLCRRRRAERLGNHLARLDDDHPPIGAPVNADQPISAETQWVEPHAHRLRRQLDQRSDDVPVPVVCLRLERTQLQRDRQRDRCELPNNRRRHRPHPDRRGRRDKSRRHHDRLLAGVDRIGAPYAAIAPLLSSTDTLQGGIPLAELGDTLTVDHGTWNG